MPFELVNNAFSFCFAKIFLTIFWYILLYGHPPSHDFICLTKSIFLFRYYLYFAI